MRAGTFVPKQPMADHIHCQHCDDGTAYYRYTVHSIANYFCIACKRYTSIQEETKNDLATKPTQNQTSETKPTTN